MCIMRSIAAALILLAIAAGGAAADEADALAREGAGLLRLDKPAEALTRYDAALRLAPGRASLHADRSKACFALERPDEALVSLDRAIELAGDAAKEGWYVMRLQAVWRGQGTQQALDGLPSVREKFPRSSDVSLLHARLLLATGRLADALELAEAMLREQPDHHGAAHVKSSTLYGLGRLEDVVVWARPQVRARPTCGRCRYHLAIALVMLGEKDEAARLLEGARRSARYLAQARLLLYRHQGEFWKAAEEARRLYASRPRQRAMGYVRALRAIARLEHARLLAKEQLKAKPLPGKEAAWAYLAAVAGERDLAEEALEGAKEPWVAGTAFRRAMAHAALGQTDAAFEWFGKAVDLGYRRPANSAPEPEFEALRKDRRWKDLARRIQRTGQDRD